MTRLVVGPFNRVEGDLEVSLEVKDGRVQAAYVNSPLYRGFEQLLRGKDPADALVFAPRICGICSVSQSAAAAQALAAAAGMVPADNGRITSNLSAAVENVADHFTHFYLFFMPDFARGCYQGHSWHAEAAGRFRAIHGTAAADALPARAAFLKTMGVLAGKWPHTLALQPGGSSRALEAAEKLRVFTMLREFRQHLENTLFGDALEAVSALDSLAALERWRALKPRGDFGRFLDIAGDLGLASLGRGPGRYLSYGAYRQQEGHFMQRGIWDGSVSDLNETLITEDLASSWMAGPAEPLPPARGVTRPVSDKGEAYSWCKAPRLNGQTMEVGAFARQLIDGHPLVRDLERESGSNVRNRVIARLLEIARVLPAMEKWVLDLVPGAAFCHQGTLPSNAEGAGLTEAARGSLGHWLSITDGRISNYQIISPTTWNFSPRDGAGTPGPLEHALAGTPIEDGETSPVAVQHVVRSFDPCMVCTVH